MKNINLIRLTVLTALLAAVFGYSGKARAAENDQLVFLTCDPAICNFGSTTAAGTAIVDLVVGSVSLQANGLSPLTAERYVVWLSNATFANSVYIGDLPVDGQLPLVTVALPGKDYTLVLITVEANGAVPAAPSARRALSGALAGPPVVAAVPAAAPTAAAVGSFDANTAGPQDAFLSYMPDVCPEGVQTGVGTGLVNFGTGEFSVQISGVDPGAGQKLSLWMLGPNLENPVYIADIPAGGQLQPVFVSLPAATYRYLMITFEAEGAAIPATRGPCALSAIFPNEAVLGTAVVAAPVAVAAPVEAPTEVPTEVPTAEPAVESVVAQTSADTELPVKLPETGAILPDGWAGRGFGLLLLMLGVGLGGSALRRKVRRS